MGYVKIQIKDVASLDDLHRWEEYMQEEAKCWNKFCFGICAKNEIRAVHVVKEGNPDVLFLTTLCEDCLKDTTVNDLLVNEKHLMVETHNQ